VSLSSSGSQVGSQDEFFVNGFRVSFLFLFIIKVGTAQAGPVVILVNFLPLPLCVAASVLEAHPMVSLAVDLTNVHVIKGGTFVSGSRPKL